MEGRVVPGQRGKGGFFCGSACRASYDGVALGVVVGRTVHVTGKGGRNDCGGETGGWTAERCR